MGKVSFYVYRVNYRQLKQAVSLPSINDCSVS